MRPPLSVPRSRSQKGIQGQQPLRILHVVTAPQAVRGLLQGQLRYLRGAGFDVMIACSPGEEARQAAAAEGVPYVPVSIERRIAPLRDMVSLFRLWRLIRWLQPTIVHVGTPKAGLLGGLAAWLAGAPCRVYTLYGLRLETARNLRRRILLMAERCSGRLAGRVICVSPSLRRRVTELRIADRGKLVLLASGSANGVEAERFVPSRPRFYEALRKREQLAIPQNAPVAGFVGRLTRDKGLVELVESFARLRNAYPDLHLLLVGPFEAGDPLPQGVRAFIEMGPRVIHVGFVEDPSVYYHVMDCLVLPSHREGYPSVVLEAAAAGKAVIAAAATGSVDAVVHGVTGLITPVGDAAALSDALASLLDDPAKRSRLGRAGQAWVRRRFDPLLLWRDLAALYHTLAVRAVPPAAECPLRPPKNIPGLRAAAR